MEIDLNRRMPKVTDLSERSYPPSYSYQRAVEAAAKLGITLNIELSDYDGLFWAAAVKPAFADVPERYNPRMKLAGKGQTKEQCLASGSMEFVERWSMSRVSMSDRKIFPCLDLRTNKVYEFKVDKELGNTKCVSSGNNFEEAILHSLHEVIETQTPHYLQWSASKIVDIDLLFPEFPQWVKDSIMLIQLPAARKEFSIFVAIQYPYNREFDNKEKVRLVPSGNTLRYDVPSAKPYDHAPNSGGAAGLNPKLVAFRAMNEIFQFQKPIADWKSGKKRILPDYMQRARKEDLVNYETDSITGDINLILDLLGEDTFVGVIDLTDPELGIPVVKVVSDYSPTGSLVSREAMSIFFDF